MTKKIRILQRVFMNDVDGFERTVIKEISNPEVDILQIDILLRMGAASYYNKNYSDMKMKFKRDLAEIEGVYSIEEELLAVANRFIITKTTDDLDMSTLIKYLNKATDEDLKKEFAEMIDKLKSNTGDRNKIMKNAISLAREYFY